MPNHIWSVLCSNSIIDRDTNNIILPVIEQLEVGVRTGVVVEEINVPANLQLVSLWEKKDDVGDFTATVEVIGPKNESVQQGEITFSFGEYSRFRTRIGFSGLKVTETGRYLFNVFLSGGDLEGRKKVASIPLQVIVNRENNE